MMKKILVSMLIILLVGCSTSNSSGSLSKQIVGEWIDETGQSVTFTKDRYYISSNPGEYATYVIVGNEFRANYDGEDLEKALIKIEGDILYIYEEGSSPEDGTVLRRFVIGTDDKELILEEKKEWDHTFADTVATAALVLYAEDEKYTGSPFTNGNYNDYIDVDYKFEYYTSIEVSDARPSKCDTGKYELFAVTLKKGSETYISCK